MSAPSPESPWTSEDRDLHAALLSRFGMTPESVAKVYELMQSATLSFTDAAMSLGLLTQEQINDASSSTDAAGHPAGTGLIETAIRRVASDRQVVVRQGQRVTPGPKLILAHDVDNPRSEKIRALRTELLLLSESNRNANIIALLSAAAGEGRSQLAAELAISFSQLGRRTLLVDADMRRPGQHVLFGSPNLYGLSDAVAHNEKPQLHPVEGLPHLSLLTSGAIPPNPLELLSDGRFAKMMQDWRKAYEFVIIDTPPVSEFADGLAIATLAGRVLVLSRAQHSLFRDTTDMLRRLSATQSHILGAVINHF
jgi:capsular exopolysaccharide synthesis family protein